MNLLWFNRVRQQSGEDARRRSFVPSPPLRGPSFGLDMSRLLTLGKRFAQAVRQNQPSTIYSGRLNYGHNQASSIYSGGLNYGRVVGAGLYSPNYSLYSHYVFPNGRIALSTLFGGRNQLNTWAFNRFSAVSQGKPLVLHPQLAWKRFYKRPSCSRQTNLPIKGIAQAVSIGLRCSFGSKPASFTSIGARKQIFAGGLKKISAAHPGKKLVQHAQLAWKSLCERSSFNMRSSLPIRSIARAVSIALSSSYVVVPGIFAMACGGNVALAQVHPNVDFIQPRKSIYMRARDGHVMVVSLLVSVLQGVVLLLRALYLAIIFSPSIAMAPFVDSFGPHYRKFWLQLVHQTLERAGPAFIKWGQWAASRPDLFPKDLCAELSKLHTKAPEHSFAYTKKMIEKAFGRKITEIFDDFEETPVASGSIAQVHRASLKCRYQGRQMKPMVVAVKVRHPGVGESIKRDFEIINIVARLSKFIPTLNWLRLDESVQQFAVFMMSQVDLAREAAHLSRFIYNFRRWKHVSFPKPVYPLVHPAVLVETFEQGECVSHYVDELQGHERLKSSLAHIGTHALLKMLLVDNFIHADMHPGNILVREAQSKPSKKRLFKSKPHVIFLDVGMTAELSKSDRSNLVEFFKAVAQRDGQTAAESTLRLSKRQNCPNPQAFIEEVKESFDFWGTPEGDLVHPADCMQQLLEQVRRHRVNVDGNVCTVMVTTLVLEGWQRKLDPDYNVMHTLQTILLKADWAKSLSYTIEGLMAP